MKTHKIKILLEFADDVYDGRKTFEIRYNDRGYQTGENLQFEVTGSSNIDDYHKAKEHPLNGKQYKIIYMINGWGLKNGYVCLGIKPV